MKITVIGTGAMGSIYAALLADAGNEVWAVDLWEEHLQVIRTSGLRVAGASGDRTVKGIRVASPADINSVGLCDLIIIATKAAGVAAATNLIAPLLRDDTLVLTIQNGLGAGARIAKYMPTENVLLGVAQGFGASMKGPGYAHHNSMSLIRIGSMETGSKSDLAVEKIAKLWRDAGFNTQSYTDINQLIWEKFICNVAYSAPCAVFNCTLGELMNNPDAQNISQRCAVEAYEAGRAKGVNITFDDPIQYVTDFGNKMPDARPSLLLDHLAKRPSEIDAINGMVPIVAAEVGTHAPYNEVVTAIVKAKEALF